MASSSSSSSGRSFTYDVFLSFRGEDTRKIFVGHLYRALKDKGLEPFIDSEDLRKGNHLSVRIIKLNGGISQTAYIIKCSLFYQYYLPKCRSPIPCEIYLKWKSCCPFIGFLLLESSHICCQTIIPQDSQAFVPQDSQAFPQSNSLLESSESSIFSAGTEPLNWFKYKCKVGFQRLNFTLSKILSGLTESNVIGSGGSGKVYRVPVNRTGNVVAVKRIWTNKKMMEQKLEKEFLAEVKILSSIRHANIVKLMCCISNETSKLLVYEYSDNRSLDRWLHKRNRPSLSNLTSSVHHVLLDWPKRLQIALGAAKGLCYMHHDCVPPIVHRDVKSSNILLDSDFKAKIADFGLAKMLVKQGELATMSAVAGSLGYMAPEYAHTTRVNEKIDVYSFGVILLELTTGREPNEGDEHTSLAEWAWRHAQGGNPMADALDQDVKEPCYLDEMCAVFQLGIMCTETLPSNRPSMKEVLHILVRTCPPSVRREKTEYAAAPLLKNSKRERVLEEYNGLATNV